MLQGNTGTFSASELKCFFLLASDELHRETSCSVVNMLHTKNRWTSSNAEKVKVTVPLSFCTRRYLRD